MGVPVELKLARQLFDEGGGFTFSFVPTTVKVENIAFAKQVTIHYTTDGINWQDDAIGFLEHFGDYDLFGGEVNQEVEQFVVRLQAAGGDFWDNNDGNNYHLSSTASDIGGAVILNLASAMQGSEPGGGFVFTTSWLEGEVLVRNLGFSKDVGIRLSVNGGLTFEDTHCTFAGTTTTAGESIGPGNEVWRFKSPELNLDTASPEFRFAVFFKNLATNEEFWDNNFQQDYKVSKTAGSVLR